MPSMSLSRPMNRPNSVVFLTSPSTVDAERMLLGEGLPGIVQGLLEAERDAALGRVDVEDRRRPLPGGGDDLARVDVLLGPAHLGDVDQALDPRLQLHEGAVVGDVGDAAVELGADRVLGFDAVPRVGLQLLHAEADALGLGVDLDDLHLDRVADRQHLGRVVDALPAHVGDVQQAVDAAEVDERAVVGDVLDHAFAGLRPRPGSDQLGALLGAGFFQHGAAGDDDVAAAAVHLEDLEGLRRPISGPTSRTGRMSTWLPGRKATAPPRSTVKPPLTRPKMTPVDALVLLERLFQAGPGFFAAGLVAGDDGLAHARSRCARGRPRPSSPTLQPAVAPGAPNSLQRHPAFGLQSDIDDGDIVLDRHHLALHDRAFDGRRMSPKEASSSAAKSSREGFRCSVCVIVLLLSQMWLARGYLRRTSRCSAPGRWAGKRRCVGLSMRWLLSEGATDQARCIPLQNRWEKPRQTRRSP